MVDPIVHGEQLTVGVVTPHKAPGPEVELHALSYGRIATVITRTKTPPQRQAGPLNRSHLQWRGCAPYPCPRCSTWPLRTFGTGRSM
jgi:hypothetical protein